MKEPELDPRIEVDLMLSGIEIGTLLDSIRNGADTAEARAAIAQILCDLHERTNVSWHSLIDLLLELIGVLDS